MRKSRRINAGIPIHPALITEHRRAAKLTQVQLGQLVGVTGTHVSTIEIGRANPSRELFDALVEHLGIDPDALRADAHTPSTQDDSRPPLGPLAYSLTEVAKQIPGSNEGWLANQIRAGGIEHMRGVSGQILLTRPQVDRLLEHLSQAAPVKTPLRPARIPSAKTPPRGRRERKTA